MNCETKFQCELTADDTEYDSGYHNNSGRLEK